MAAARYTKLVMDDDGESHFEEAALDLPLTEFAPPAAPIGFAPLTPLESGFFLGADGGWKGDQPHPAPRRQILVVMTGSLDVTASDGEVRSFGPGELIWIEDTAGKGHQTTLAQDSDTTFFGAVLA